MRDLRVRSARAKARGEDGRELAKGRRAVPDGPQARHRDGTRVLRRNCRLRAGNAEATETWDARVRDAGADQCSRPRGSWLLERKSRRLRRTDAADGISATRSAQRAFHRARGADGTDGGRISRGAESAARDR